MDTVPDYQARLDAKAISKPIQWIYLYDIQLYDLLFREEINFHQALISNSVYLCEIQDDTVD